MPRISVIIPTYNRAALAARAAFSALDQTFRDLEVLVVDDASQDQTPELMEWLSEALPDAKRRLKYVRLDQNAGANAARNLGIRMAQGQYLAFLDSDDLWHRHKLHTQLMRMASQLGKNAGNKPFFSFTGRLRVDDQYRPLARQFAGSMRDAPRKILRANTIGTLSSVLLTSWVARHVGGFDEGLKACQDWDFFVRTIPFCHVVGSPEPLVMYFDGQIERISLNPRQRLKAHLWMHRTHLKGLPERELTEFYRNVAEDLEGLGKTSLARRFLSRSKWLGGSYWEAARLALNSGAPGVRATRYAAYQQQLGAADGESLEGYARALAFGEELARRLGTGSGTHAAQRNGSADDSEHVEQALATLEVSA